MLAVPTPTGFAAMAYVEHAVTAQIGVAPPPLLLVSYVAVVSMDEERERRRGLG